MLRTAKKYAYENLITRETQFEKPVDEDEDDEEEESILPSKGIKNSAIFKANFSLLSL